MYCRCKESVKTFEAYFSQIKRMETSFPTIIPKYAHFILFCCDFPSPSHLATSINPWHLIGDASELEDGFTLLSTIHDEIYCKRRQDSKPCQSNPEFGYF